MASSSGTTTSSGSSSLLQNSGSEEDLRLLMDQRKRKRMLSNRESARRSRLRKQKQLDDLMAQVAHLRKDNSQIVTSLNMTTQHYLNIDSENSVLRAQEAELTHRLDSLMGIVRYLNVADVNDGFDHNGHGGHGDRDFFPDQFGSDAFMINPLMCFT